MFLYEVNLAEFCSLLNACEKGRITSVRCEVEENGRCLPRVLFKFRELSPMYFNFEFTSNCEQYSTEKCKCISCFLCTRLGRCRRKGFIVALINTVRIYS